MTEAISIRYCRHADIDPSKWDRCIEHAPNGSIYAYSFYLNQMAMQWDALISGDYETVMPLTWKKKWGIHYLYQPPFTAALGIIGNNITEDTVRAFLKAIPPTFKIIEIDLNGMNMLSMPITGMVNRTNLLLPLNKPYDQLRKAYRENTRRDCVKAIQMGCTCQKTTNAQEIFRVAQKQMGFRKDPHQNGLHRLEELYHMLEQKKRATAYGLYLPTGQLIAGAVFFFSHKRAYYILAANSPESRGYKSSHCIIDHFIQAHAGSDLILDFEGSDVPGIAFFYRSFGAVPEHYPAFRSNRLPGFIRWLKK